MLAILGGTALVLALALCLSTNARLNRRFDVLPRKIAVEHSAEAIERGRRLARVYLCHDCHGEDLGGQLFADIPFTAFLPAGNLTRGAGGAAARYAPEDWVRAVLHGLRPDGRPLVFMPSHYLRGMSDGDLADIVAFIWSVPAINRQWPPATVKLGGRLMMVATTQTVLPAEVIDHHRARMQPPRARATVDYGRHLATATGCRACHRADLSGGAGPPPGGANLRPGGAVEGWTESDFVRALRSGTRPDGSQIAASMPRDYASLSDVELRALWLYLQSLPSARPPS
ncbi:MAG: c-type cytochrome [Luteitalea sp.]